MTKRTRDVIYKVAMHAALLAGGVLFAFPFVWLVTTTFKGDEEVFSERMNWIPKIPHYSSTSPYLDQRAYDEMRPPTGRDKRGWWASEQMLRDRLWERAQELAPELGIDLPPEAQEQVARGLWVHVRDTLPAVEVCAIQRRARRGDGRGPSDGLEPHQQALPGWRPATADSGQ